MSTGWPTQSFFATSSGAMQLGVPQWSESFFEEDVKRLKPKSIIFTSQFLFTIILSSLMSLCAIFLLCKYSTPLTIFLNIFLVSCSDNLFLFFCFKYQYNESFPMYSMTSTTCFPVSIVVQSFIIFGWSSILNISISLFTFSLLFQLLILNL